MKTDLVDIIVLRVASDDAVGVTEAEVGGLLCPAQIQGLGHLDSRMSTFSLSLNLALAIKRD